MSSSKSRRKRTRRKRGGMVPSGTRRSTAFATRAFRCATGQWCPRQTIRVETNPLNYMMALQGQLTPEDFEKLSQSDLETYFLVYGKDGSVDHKFDIKGDVLLRKLENIYGDQYKNKLFNFMHRGQIRRILGKEGWKQFLSNQPINSSPPPRVNSHPPSSPPPPRSPPPPLPNVQPNFQRNRKAPNLPSYQNNSDLGQFKHLKYLNLNKPISEGISTNPKVTFNANNYYKS